MAKLTEAQAAFLQRRLKGKKLITDDEQTRAQKMAARGFVTIKQGPPRAADRSKRTHWQYAELTDAGRKAWQNDYLKAIEG